VTKITYPNDTVVTFHYDMSGRLASVGDSLDADKYARLTYTARDEIDSLILGNDLQRVNYAYNERGWLTSINGGIPEDTSSDLFGEVLEYYGTDREPTWPAYYNGNIAAQKLAFSHSDTIVHLYEYDEIDRLVDAHMGTAADTVPEPYREYAYDKNGNRISLKLDGDTVGWTYDYSSGTNQLIDAKWLGASQEAFTYDASGNVDTCDYRFFYDIYNQLRWADSLGTDYLKFGYNVAGERVWKYYHWTYIDSSGGKDSLPVLPLLMMMGGGGGIPQIVHDSAITWYIRGADGKVLAEYDPVNEEYLHTFIYAGNQRIAMFDKLGALHFYLNDHLGSARRVITSNGTSRDKYVYHPFGGESSFTINTLQTRRYTGKTLDEEMGLDLYYYGARYYDPDLGRFTQIDPHAHNYPSWGPYGYVRNNPLRRTDPTGMDDNEENQPSVEKMLAAAADRLLEGINKLVSVVSATISVGPQAGIKVGPAKLSVASTVDITVNPLGEIKDYSAGFEVQGALLDNKATLGAKTNSSGDVVLGGQIEAKNLKAGGSTVYSAASNSFTSGPSKAGYGPISANGSGSYDIGVSAGFIGVELSIDPSAAPESGVPDVMPTLKALGDLLRHP